MSKERVGEIDIIRTIAMGMVVLFHVGVLFFSERYMYPVSVEELWENWRALGFNPFFLISVVGDQAVPLFLFLSGYLLVRQKEIGDFNWLKCRLRKILLPYWIAVLGSSWMVWLAWRWAPEVLERTVAGEFSWSGVLWALLLLQNSTEQTFNVPLPAWWFIPLLVHLYVLYPMLKWMLERWGTKLFLKAIFSFAILWNLLILWIWQEWSPPYALWFSGVSYVSVFGLGMGVSRVENVGMRIEKYKLLSFSTGFILWLVGWGMYLMSGRMMFVALAVEAAGWFLMLYVVSCALSVRVSNLSSRLAYVGRRWSYYVYLWHQPVLFLGAAILYNLV